jgi:hypothetical protein
MHNISILFVIDDLAMGVGWGLTEAETKSTAFPVGYDSWKRLSLKLLLEGSHRGKVSLQDAQRKRSGERTPPFPLVYPSTVLIFFS